MTVIVTKKPGGITQLFNTETGKVTYKCKSQSAYMLIEAFGGIVRFNQKGALATVTGDLVSVESCDIIKEGDSDYKKALDKIIQAHKEFAQNIANMRQKEIWELESKLSKL
jgi:flagellar capping protein FliD